MWQLWLSGLIGIWLVCSPWVYDFADNSGAFWNNIIFGIIILILSIWVGNKEKSITP
ncbi:SPW repeat-containing protein [Neobacillus bataviensis LMG 21833]|uniref:SPW repeat-containing protein n=1 Tax=Neobacillus bataviensis LMG 21833 TaxID=1117379 RepID=K6E7P3_9BACI|nr:SPW repeat protein [Neobacillus bataviensis]EKN69331.1 SPW repeat-containing protein [Neobacillus bataviensis LMG 21833]